MKKLFTWVVILLVVGVAGFVGLQKWMNGNADISYDDGIPDNCRSVTYKVDDTIYFTEYPYKGDQIILKDIPETDENETYYYNGWKLEGSENIITTDTIVVNNDMTLVANKVAKAVVREKVDGIITNTYYFKHGVEIILTELEPETETHYYANWQLEGSDEVFTEFPAEFVVNEDMTFFTNKLPKVVVTYMKDGAKYGTQYVIPGEILRTLVLPSDGNNYYYESEWKVL